MRAKHGGHALVTVKLKPTRLKEHQTQQSRLFTDSVDAELLEACIHERCGLFGCAAFVCELRALVACCRARCNLYDLIGGDGVEGCSCALARVQGRTGERRRSERKEGYER